MFGCAAYPARGDHGRRGPGYGTGEHGLGHRSVDVGRRVLLSLSLGVDDAGIADAALSAAKLGFDCPLGWPDDFLRFLQAYQAGRVVPPQDVAGRDWRRRLAYRATDRAVREVTGLTPLSVAADRGPGSTRRKINGYG